jgi:hypothetical protein
MEDLNAATLDDIKEWYRTYYGPNNAVICLAGDITPERALELVTKYFGGIPPGPPLPRTEKWIPTLDRNIRDEMEDLAPQARVYRIYHAPAWKDPCSFTNSRAKVINESRSRPSRRGFEARAGGLAVKAACSTRIFMEPRTEKKNERPSKPYRIERLPNGQKPFCFAVRRHGKKLAIKLTPEQLEKELKAA